MAVARPTGLPDMDPAIYPALVTVEARLAECGLERGVMKLAKLRASQLNGCAFCLDMHARDARAHGEGAQRLDLLAGWRDAPVYTDRERAALAWTEALTDLDPAALAAARAGMEAVFSVPEIAHLTMLVGMINMWNRVMPGLGIHPPVRA